MLIIFSIPKSRHMSSHYLSVMGSGSRRRVGRGPLGSILGTAGGLANVFGLGKRRKKRQTGGAIFDRLKNLTKRWDLGGLARAVHSQVKAHQLISRGLTHFGHPKWAEAAKKLGYGRSIGLVGGRRKRRGGSITLADRIQDAENLHGTGRRGRGFLSGILGSLGLGRKRRKPRKISLRDRLIDRMNLLH